MKGVANLGEDDIWVCEESEGPAHVAAGKPLVRLGASSEAWLEMEVSAARATPDSRRTRSARTPSDSDHDRVGTYPASRPVRPA